MSFEFVCPTCGERLVVEQPGSIVACPHCSAHMKSPHGDSVESDSEEGSSIHEPVQDESIFSDSADSSIFPGLPRDDTESQPDSRIHITTEEPASTPDERPFPLSDEQTIETQEPVIEEPGGQEKFPNFGSIEEQSSEQESDDQSGEAQMPEQEETVLIESSISDEGISQDTPQSESDFETEDLTALESESLPEPSPVPEPQTSPSGEVRTVSRNLFVLVASYASAITIVFLFYLWMTAGRVDPHQLESLPDVVPKEDAQGHIERIVVSEAAPMPPGHTLELGSTQRFGDLEVTPLRVTRGPLEFTHFAKGDEESKPPTGPVLKLWLHIKNVSEDREFMPLGADLVFYRGPTPRYPEKLRANNFVCRVEEKHEQGDLVLHYDHVVEDVWNLKGQNIERGLKPGEEFETFLPSDEDGIEDLTGNLIWRVHLRKGINAKTGWGVTTLIEVEFHSDEIQVEAEPEESIEDGEKSV